MSQDSIFFPQITSIPQTGGIDQGEGRSRKRIGTGSDQEFNDLFEKKIQSADVAKDLNQIRTPLKFSAHASQRLKDRKILLDGVTLSKVNEAVEKADAKGVQDTLVLTQDAALIVNVKNKTVITAMDRGSLTGNIFTNIDGAVIV